MEEEGDFFDSFSLFYPYEDHPKEKKVNIVQQFLSSKRHFHNTFASSPSLYLLDKLHAKILVDTIDSEFIHFFYGTPLCNRSRVCDIIQFHNYLIVLSRKGACQVYDIRSYKRHMFLNPTKFDVVQTVFVNRLNDQLIVVTYHSFDGQNILQCRSVTADMIDQKDVSKGYLLFQDDLFTSPSYFEFDEFNEVIITYCASKQEYKIWKQSDYSFLYSIRDDNIQEMRVGKGILLIAQSVSHLSSSDILILPIMAVQLYTGEIIYRANFFLHSTSEVEFLEVFEEYIFIKQRDHRLVIYSMIKNRIMNLNPSQGLDSKLIVFLNYQSLFLVFSRKSIDVYDSHLQRKIRYMLFHSVMFSLKKNTSYADNTHENIAFISSKQDFLVCYYSDKLRTGKIDIFDLLTGSHLFFRDSRSMIPSDNYGLEDVSGILYDFERNSLYTGTRAGLLHIWSV